MYKQLACELFGISTRSEDVGELVIIIIISSSISIIHAPLLGLFAIIILSRYYYSYEVKFSCIGLCIRLRTEIDFY